MKRLLTALLALALCAAPALASGEGVLPVTQAFLAEAAANSLIYTYYGQLNDGFEAVILPYNDFDVIVLIDPDGNHAELRAYRLISCPDADPGEVCRVLDRLNGSYKYVTFQTDGEGGVMATCDLLFANADPAAAGRITLATADVLARVVGAALPELQALAEGSSAVEETPAEPDLFDWLRPSDP